MPTDQPHTRRGFTIVEMLVVIAIIIALLGILIPTIANIRPNPWEVQLLTNTGIALQAYHNDFNDYPPSDYTKATAPICFGAWSGGEILAQALVGPQPNGVDGQMGYGWTKDASLTGKSYGPYLNIQTEKQTLAESAPGRWVLTVATSQSKRGVLYYRADNAGATGTLGGAGADVWDNGGRFNLAHNNTLVGADNPVDYWRTTASATDRNTLSIPLRSAEYLLISPGIDEQYGDGGGAREYDDTYRFGR
ncbi:MAG: hypothetical protein GC159_06745 [Phycisphaera sp.]|nr:hypothetical protein [Phycisphaera sp.]